MIENLSLCTTSYRLHWYLNNREENVTQDYNFLVIEDYPEHVWDSVENEIIKRFYTRKEYFCQPNKTEF